MQSDKGMKTVGDKLDPFEVNGLRPGRDLNGFYKIDQTTFNNKWKIILFYPMDFAFDFPTEIVEHDLLVPEFDQLNAVLLTGNTDGYHCKLAWQNTDSRLYNLKHTQFSDTQRGYFTHDRVWINNSLSRQLGIFDSAAGYTARSLFIVSPDNIIKHITVNDYQVAINAEETLRILKSLQ